MKDFLEGLELGESKYKLSKEEIKSIMVEHGKSIKTESEKVENNLKQEIESYKTTIEDLKGQIDKLPKTDELESLRSQVADYEKKEQQRQAEEQDKILTNNILELFGDKKFTSDYAKNGLLNDIKNGLNLPENKGKGIKEIFDSLTKDRTGIFENENKIQDMAPMESVENVSELKGGLDIKLNPMFKNYN